MTIEITVKQVEDAILRAERMLGRHRYHAHDYTDKEQMRLARAENLLTEARGMLEPPEITCPHCNGKGTVIDR